MFSSFISNLFHKASGQAAGSASILSAGLHQEHVSVESPEVTRKSFDDKLIEKLKMEAHCSEHGIGVPADINRAFSLYEKGAELGGAFAIYKLGRFYAEGRVVSQNLEMASFWYKKGMRLFPNEPVFRGKLADLHALIQAMG